MRRIQSSKARTHLARLLTEVERGETVIITRRGRAIARLVPEKAEPRASVKNSKSEIARFRQTMPKLSLQEIQSARHEGHKY